MQWEIVNRVVFPIRDQDLTLPLYAIEWTRPHLPNTVIDPRIDMHESGISKMNRTETLRLIAESASLRPANTSSDVFSVISRSELNINPSKHVSLCTYFNAFPASYWRKWTKVKEVRLTALVKGKGTINVFKSTGRGLIFPVTSITTDSTEHYDSVEATIPLKGVLDGGFFWFDAASQSDSPLSVKDASWSVPKSNKTSDADSSFSIAITTFNRASYCLNQLKAIAADHSLRQRLDTVYCVDQGTQHVIDEDDFEQTSHDLGKQLTYIQQSNLGGSGGFSRGMLETLENGKSSYVLLLDDDAISEPEAILRSVQFADYTEKPALIGGGMLHLDNRTVLYRQGERFLPNRVWMDSPEQMSDNHDFASLPLRDAPDRHRRIDADFNAWFMCLIPTTVLKEIGLSLPVFIKFDDVEFGIRAKEHGFPTISLPGVAVWHQSWHDKDPSRTWEEYFLQRNRWICALLHNERPSLRFMLEMIYADAHVGMKLTYSALRLHHMALRDILRGPEYIVKSLPTKLEQINMARQGFDDSTSIEDVNTIPVPSQYFTVPHMPSSKSSVLIDGTTSVIKAFLSCRNGKQNDQPDVAIPSHYAIWRSFKSINSALVTSTDGNTVAWRKRDSRLFRRQIIRGTLLALELQAHWKSLSQQYRAASLASIEVWKEIFSLTKKSDSYQDSRNH